MTEREMVMLGTASRAPTRLRNQNSYLLRWDGRSILFDPGEGTQRQFAVAGLSTAPVERICITHFHGDHCLGLPGMMMRLALHEGKPPVPVHYPASGEEFFRRLRCATPGQENVSVDARPIAEPGVIHRDDALTLRCAPLRHRVDAVGYRLEEADGRRFSTDRLAALGIDGAKIGALRDNGSIEHRGRTVHLDEVTDVRPGQVVAFVMDTAWCDGALELAADADLLVCESTFLSRDEHLAAEFGHMTARQAGRLARESGARRLVLSHFSRRYDDEHAFGAEARLEFDEVIVANDLDRIAVPPRR